VAYTYDVNIILSPGDMIVDIMSNDVGLLIERYKVLPENTYANGIVTEAIWGWRIAWAGADMHASNRFASSTETGLKNQIIEGRVNLIKVDHT